MPIHIREFSASDIARVLNLWRETRGIVLRDVDSPQALGSYLSRNPAVSFIALDGGEIVGAVLCGTDGRRGYLQHLAVASTHRGNGIGRQLAERSVAALAAVGVDKCHLMVLADNLDAQAFWRHIGWNNRTDVRLMSHTQSGAKHA